MGLLKLMNQEFAQWLAEIMNMIEANLKWPAQVLINIVTLMGKPMGGIRPIALMPMVYRLWTKCRKSDIQAWDSKHRGHWDAAVAGSSALRAAVLTIFRDELESYDEQTILRILWDMEKFYDTIDIVKLIKRAKQMGYPFVLL